MALRQKATVAAEVVLRKHPLAMVEALLMLVVEEVVAPMECFADSATVVAMAEQKV